MPFPAQPESPEVSFLNIANNLSNLSRLVAGDMPATPVLGERSVNVPLGSNVQGKEGSRKRKSDGAENAVDPDDVDLDHVEIKWSANQVRTKIRQYVNSGEMKVGEFQDKLGVSSTGYSRFMNQSGPQKGVESDTFIAAAMFFKRTEIAGLKMPRASKKAKTESKSTGAKSGDSTKEGGADGDGDQKATKPKKQSKSNAHDVSSVHLDGEDSDRVPVFDTCDDLRTKINRFLRQESSASNASLSRLITASLPPASDYKPTARHLTTFLGKYGPTAGPDSPVFYAGYVFFEKLRVKDGKPKSKKRVEMEDVWSKKGGLELVDLNTCGLLCRPGEKPHIDKYGKLEFY